MELEFRIGERVKYAGEIYTIRNCFYIGRELLYGMEEEVMFVNEKNLKKVEVMNWRKRIENEV